MTTRVSMLVAGLLTAAAVLAGPGATARPSVEPGSVVAASAPPVTIKLKAAVKGLVWHRQTHQALYVRDQDFGDWVDQGGGCDTRAVVLKTESRAPTTQNADCTIESGRWRSYYNRTTYTDPRDLQIDRVVPVADAWGAGAWDWEQATRVAFYNDLVDPRSLVAVDAHDNKSKGDQTPATWVPPHGVCRYVRDWVTVKLRWQLTVTNAELRALKRYANDCLNQTIRYTPATVVLQ